MDSDGQLLSEGDEDYGPFSVLADPRQRQILSILLDQTHPLTERDLSLEVAARETSKEPAEVAVEEHETIQVDLYHRCLPKLEAAGWIERSPEGVITTESLVSWDEDSSAPDLQNPEHPFWEAVGTLFARPRRMELVSIIADQPPNLSLEELATELEEWGPDSRTAEQRESEPALLSTLHHLDLPELAEAGLIEYDHDEKTITRTPTLMTLLNQSDLNDR
jgi:hypothetical protein